MVSDPRAAQARAHHLAAQAAEDDAARARASRDELVRLLRGEDPRFWTYKRLAEAVGCSPELIVKIIRPQRR